MVDRGRGHPNPRGLVRFSASLQSGNLSYMKTPDQPDQPQKPNDGDLVIPRAEFIALTHNLATGLVGVLLKELPAFAERSRDLRGHDLDVEVAKTAHTICAGTQVQLLRFDLEHVRTPDVENQGAN